MSVETYEVQESTSLVGWQRVNRPREGRWGQQPSAQYQRRVAAAAEFLSEALSGRMPSWALREAIAPSAPGLSDVAVRRNFPELYTVREAYSTSDFANLMGDVLDRMMLQDYRAMGHNWRAYVGTRRPLTDFRAVKVFTLDGAAGQYAEITEADELTYSTTLADGVYTYEPKLYGLGVKLTWRAIMNDDLEAFDTIPRRLGRGGRRTVEKFVTELFFDSSGPDATFFSVGNGNLLSGNPDLAIDSLGTAFETLLGFTDTDGEPILVEGVTLVYPPALHVTVMNLLNQLSVDVTEEGGTSNQVVRVNNWIVRDLDAVMNPYIPIVATSNGNTSWALFSNPATGRPAGQIGFVAGFEEPRLYRKASNSQLISGGIDQMAGDFATMDHHYKGLVAFGGVAMDPTAAVASNGSNS